jgi:SAM-dependent methyltransferase
MPAGRLVTSDVAPEMVEVARRRATELGVNDVAFAVEDAASLSFDDASFDGVLWRWGPMLVPDMEAAIGEVRRVLRPGGRAAIAVWASPSANEWMTASGRAALELGLVDPPDRDAPGPFRLAGDGLLKEALEHGGLHVDVVEDVALTWQAPSLGEWWSISLDMSRTLALLAERLTPDELTAVEKRAEELLAGYVQPDGTLAVPSLARVALATR